jgi:acyl carrier protein
VNPATLDRLLAVMSDVLRTPKGQLSATSRAEDVADWDSLRTIYLATAIESEFGVTLTPDEIAGLVSVPEVVQILAGKGVT